MPNNANALSVPFLPAVAYPTHMLYVPRALWAINVVAAVLAAFLGGIVMGGGLRGEFSFAVFVPLHILFAWLYRKDPFVADIWNAWISARPIAPMSGTRNLGGGSRRLQRFG